jgi:hypothetical protein
MVERCLCFDAAQGGQSARRRYAPITGADFLRSRLEPTYASVKT